jgi:hypothetical protein
MNDPEHNQVGGSHYKDLPIQPARYISKNGIGFLAGCVIKRMTRYNRPTGDGLLDLEKARHEIDLIIKYEYGCQEGQNLDPRPAKPSAIIWRTHTPGDPCPVEDGETEISWRYTDGPAWHLTGRCKANDAPWNEITEYRIF